MFSKFTIIFGLHYQQNGEIWTTSLPCLLPRFARLNVNSSKKEIKNANTRFSMFPMLKSITRVTICFVAPLYFFFGQVPAVLMLILRTTHDYATEYPLLSPISLHPFHFAQEQTFNCTKIAPQKLNLMKSPVGFLISLGRKSFISTCRK